MSASRDSITDPSGPRTPHQAGQWSERVDENVAEAPERWVSSACVLCSTGCGLDIGVKDDRIVGVRGRANDRVNRGRLGPKGLHGWQANASADRLRAPLIRRHGRLQPASWDEAMALVVEHSRDVIAAHGPSGMAFYSTGQLVLEEYWTLATIARAGIGTPHVDANTRLCTATASMALIESFGCDGDPGSYRDIDLTDALFLVGHNMAETQTVLWSRVLDRRRSANPPQLIVVDPRATASAREADVHLQPRVGTNVALLNGLLRLIIDEGAVNREWMTAHTVGYAKLAQVLADWPVARAAEVTRIPVEKLRAAAEILSRTPTLVSTVLQGVYQSHQATAAAVQVNNLHLLRGLIGKPGSTVFQMNGQPSAQNTRECGADGELAGFRNWHNELHVEEMARHWNVDPQRIPHWAPPTHASQIFRYVESGSIRFLWIIGTNPAVSMPELHRMRTTLGRGSCFIVVEDAFPTETTELADVVLPAAMWGEKTGCITNADRTVHLCERAIDPPAEARSDFDILVDYARRMELRDRDGMPLIKWSDPESAFEAFKATTRGRLCDYSGLSYGKLRGRGVQWPCNDAAPDGTERLYTDGVFMTGSDVCETFGHDLVTGAEITPEEYRARDPRGKAIVKAAEWVPLPEEPDESYPFVCTTGRVVYHFHTRTKTARAPALQAAAPEPFVQLSAEDAARLGIADGERVIVESRRGGVVAPARVGDIAPGHAFVPFHYGYWDSDQSETRAANELTRTGWDPVSKQPYVKLAAVRIRKA